MVIALKLSTNKDIENENSGNTVIYFKGYYAEFRPNG